MYSHLSQSKKIENYLYLTDSLKQKQLSLEYNLKL